MRSNGTMQGAAGTLTLALALGLVTVAGCERDEQAAVENVGRGAVGAAKTVGHGAVYGAREIGQSLSGTQGNPEAEARARRAREAMEQNANEAGSHIERAGEAVHIDPAPRRGGGPND